jgi:hypothetical protein
MTGDDQEDRGDFVCSFCGKKAIDIQREMIFSLTDPGRICDECLKLIAEIHWERIVEVAAETQSRDANPTITRLMMPQIITRFVSENVNPVTWSDLGVDWICDGCGWRLRLDSNAQPPQEHSYEIMMGSWLDIRVEKIPERKFASMCTTRWRRLL